MYAFKKKQIKLQNIIEIFESLRIINTNNITGKAMIVANDYHIPVSYTHLDVYKRQSYKSEIDVGKNIERFNYFESWFD